MSEQPLSSEVRKLVLTVISGSTLAIGPIGEG